LPRHAGDCVDQARALPVVLVAHLDQAQAILHPRLNPRKLLRRAKGLRIGDRVFQRQGFHNTSVDQIISEAMVSKGNFFHHFKNKEELGYAVIDSIRAEMSGFIQTEEGEIRVAAFTDLKRHVICDTDDPFFCNERLRQDFVPTNQFMTARLWDVGSSAPYGHRGDLTTVSEVIVHHSGEAKSSKQAFLGHCFDPGPRHLSGKGKI
jgi:AcrR family transcriptional regulator